MRFQLNAEQAHRLTNAAVLLQLLENQLREELNILQSTLASTEAKPPPLTKGMTDRLEKTTVTVEMLCDQPRCPICSEDYVVPEDVLRIPCSHYFHSDCVMPWLEAKRTCPMCRYELCNEVPPKDELRKLTLDELKTRIHNHESDEVEEEAAEGEEIEEGTRQRSNSVDECFEREVLVERYYDLLVKEKHSHDRMEAQAREVGLGTGGGMTTFNQMMERQRLARTMQMRPGGAGTENFHPHTRRHAPFPVGRLIDQVPDTRETRGRRLWLQSAGTSGVRVLRIAAGPGSMRHDNDDDGFPPYRHGVSAGMGLMMRAVPVGDRNEEEDSDDEDEEEQNEEEDFSGTSGSMPSVRMISYPHRGGVRHIDSTGQGGEMPTFLSFSDRNVHSTVSTSTMPTRTTYILRTVNGTGSGGSAVVYHPHAVSPTHEDESVTSSR